MLTPCTRGVALTQSNEKGNYISHIIATRMSFLRKSSNAKLCNSCNVKPDTGAISLQIVPVPTQVHENQSKKALSMQNKLASDVQNQYFADMDLQSCNTHMKTCDTKQCNETMYANNASLHSVPQLLSDANLTIRVNHMDHGIDSQATCAEVTAESLNEMLSNGSTEVQASTGTFELQSANNHTITSIKYFPKEA